MFEKAGNRLFPTSTPQTQDPPGPPLSHRSSSYEPPPGPPPGHDDAPPPYHDWTVIPDTALLPPPPGMAHDFSFGANATQYEAEQAKQWCYFNSLWLARPLSDAQLRAIHSCNHKLVSPQDFSGEIRRDNYGAWLCKTRSNTRDSLVQTSLPIYSAPADSPLLTERPRTIYFEVKIIRFGEAPAKQSKNPFSRHKHQEAQIESGLAIGFFAPPYPTFRLPGWQRGSLGVHSDDGRRYVNDTHGGMDFVSPFQAGQTIGLGMTFKLPANPPAYGEQCLGLDVEVFFTRDGKREGGWNLHEERDFEDDPHGVEGLEGAHDLFPAVGVFGAVEWEVSFKEHEWLYRPGK